MKLKPIAGTTLIRGGRVIDPARGVDRVDDVLIADGRIESVGPASGSADRTVDATGLLVLPGFVDPHVHLREPGGEAQETIETGTKAAAAGGFTTVACMPNTRPPIDNPQGVRFVLDKVERVGHCRVCPVAAITVGQRGEQAVDMAALKAAGAVAFSDDGAGVNDDRVMQEVIEHARECDALLIQHCEVAAIAEGGVMHRGSVSEELCLPGIDPRAEEEMLARDLELLRTVPVRYHVAHVSTAGAVKLVRQAKAEGLPVTAEVTVHHLVLTHEACRSGNPNTKVNPPLRTAEDVEACRQGLADGTIDCICTDHAPHTVESKAAGMLRAPFGMTGLETAWAVLSEALLESGRLDLPGLVKRTTCGPARVLRLLDRGGLGPGMPADLTLVDPDVAWTIDVSSFVTKGKNTPFDGWPVRGRPVATMLAGGWSYLGDTARGRVK